jgi:hypothetical protein
MYYYRIYEFLLQNIRLTITECTTNYYRMYELLLQNVQHLLQNVQHLLQNVQHLLQNVRCFFLKLFWRTFDLNCAKYIVF